MDIFNRNGLSPDQPLFSQEGIFFSVPPARLCRSVVMVGLTHIFSHLACILENEGYRPVEATVPEAFETIRWEQPALALIDGGLHGEKCITLLRRLRTDPSTRNMILVVYAVEPYYNLFSAFNQRIQVVSNLSGAKIALHSFFVSARPNPVSNLRFPFFLPKISQPASHSTGDLQILLANVRLREFVDLVIDAWPTLLLLSYISRVPDAVFNLALLSHRFNLCLHESDKALEQLAKAGFIEPLEFDLADPLYCAVAHPEQKYLLAEFGKALLNTEYRTAIATLVLARQRTAI